MRLGVGRFCGVIAQSVDWRKNVQHDGLTPDYSPVKVRADGVPGRSQSLPIPASRNSEFGPASSAFGRQRCRRPRVAIEIVWQTML